MEQQPYVEEEKQSEIECIDENQKKEEKNFLEGMPDVLHLTIEDGKPTPDIESMCMYCHGTGVTRFMQITIPFFKQVMISAFSCEECGYKNNEVQFTG
jgi:zinc finger protein